METLKPFGVGWELPPLGRRPGGRDDAARETREGDLPDRARRARSDGTAERRRCRTAAAQQGGATLRAMGTRGRSAPFDPTAAHALALARRPLPGSPVRNVVSDLA